MVYDFGPKLVNLRSVYNQVSAVRTNVLFNKVSDYGTTKDEVI